MNSNIIWVNAPNSRFNGVYISLRTHREARGFARLMIYLSERAAKDLELRRGERILVGLDESGSYLYLRPTLFGGNVIKGKDDRDTLEVQITLPLATLPRAQHVSEGAVQRTGEVLQLPFKFNPVELGSPTLRQGLRVAS